MKILLHILAVLFATYSAAAQMQKKEAFDVKLPVAEINDGALIENADAKAILKEVNINLFGKNNVLHTLTVLSGTTLGEKQETYYYMKLSSKDKTINIVRLLYKHDGKLYLEDSDGSFDIRDYYISCEGSDSCFPRLFYSDGRYIWSCRDTLVCIISDDEENKCEITTSAIYE